MAILTEVGRAEDDLSYARILYESKLATVDSIDFTAPAALIPNTWERWIDAGGTMEARFQTASVTTISAVGIAAHNLGTAGASVVVATSPTVGGTFTDRAAATPQNNVPLLFLFDPVDGVADVRVTITGGVNREVGVVYAGEPLIMQRAVYGGHSPITLAGVTEYRNSMSDSGQFLGRKERRKGAQNSFAWQYLTPDWYREKFQPFVDSAKTNPFFIKWRPDLHSDEVGFGYTTGDIIPSNMGGGIQFLSVSMSMRAHDQ